MHKRAVSECCLIVSSQSIFSNAQKKSQLQQEFLLNAWNGFCAVACSVLTEKLWPEVNKGQCSQDLLPLTTFSLDHSMKKGNHFSSPFQSEGYKLQEFWEELQVGECICGCTQAVTFKFVFKLQTEYINLECF